METADDPLNYDCKRSLAYKSQRSACWPASIQTPVKKDHVVGEVPTINYIFGALRAFLG
jgi:hypothetical protein